MSYLCKVQFDPSNAPAGSYCDVERLNRNPHVQHQQLSNLFALSEHPGSFIFHHRVNERRMPTFTMISNLAPRTDCASWHVQVERYQPSFTLGQHFEFETRINPQLNMPTSEGRPRFTDLVTRLLKQNPDCQLDEQGGTPSETLETELLNWFAAYGEKHGFLLQTDTIVTRCMLQRFLLKGRQTSISVADFVGKLVVTDAPLFTRTVIEGCGHSRRFGCGALLLRTVRRAHTLSSLAA
jgi:CRISPR-associated protein Cas6/Cse3/CasE subtype I-E